MKNSKLIRTWRNQDVRATVEDAVVANPAGVSELDEKLLGSIGGATSNACSGTRLGMPTWCLACNQ